MNPLPSRAAMFEYYLCPGTTGEKTLFLQTPI